MRQAVLFFVFILMLGSVFADTIISANITTSTTWNLAGSPYIIQGSRIISGATNPIVTVEPGVVIKFNASANLQIGSNSSSSSPGGLIVNGTASQPVLFTANSSSPVPGFWSHVRTNTYASTDQAIFNYAIFEYGGSQNANFEVGGGNPAFFHCTFRYSENDGIYHASATAGAQVTDCLFDSNGMYPLQVNSTKIHMISTGNQYVNNALQRIFVNSENLTEGHTWLNQGIPYEFDNSQYVYTGSNPLILLPGTELLFGSGKKLYVGYGSSSATTGCISAEGVTFGAVNPALGWYGIEFQPYTQASDLTNCTIRDVSSVAPGAIYIRSNGLIDISGCLITDCDTYGLFTISGAAFSWNGNTIRNCSETAYVYPRDVAKLGSGNHYQANLENEIYIPGGTINVSGTWTRQEVPLRVGGGIEVYASGGCSVTIPYGVVMKFAGGIGFHVGYSSSESSSGSLYATGVVFRGVTATAGFWDGLYFNRYSGGIVLSGCVIQDAGNANYAGITVANSVTTITGCVINNCLARGISVSNGFHANISANTISSCGSYPLSIDAAAVHYISNSNYLTGNTLDYVEVKAVTVDANTTWRNQGIPYYLTDTINVYASTVPKLTILPGTVVMIPHQKMLVLGYAGSPTLSGALEATGATFTRKSSGDAPYGLYFQNYLDDAHTILTNCVFEYLMHGTQNTAVYCNTSSPSFVGCTFRNNPGHGIGGGNNSHFSVVNCSFTDNGGYPIKTTAEAFAYVSGSGNSFSGNNPNRILISGSNLSAGAIWNNPGIPVEVTGDITVYGSAFPILTLNSGLHLTFQTGTGLSIGYTGSPTLKGGLYADGARFSALNGTAGGWDGLIFNQYMLTDSYIRYCIVEHGGANGCVWVNNAPLSQIFDCVIRYGTIGIKLNGTNANPDIWRNHIVANNSGIVCQSNANPLIGGSLGNGNSITANTVIGVSNSSSAITLNAEYNWWGDAAGPTLRLGDGVSTFVDYDPWRTTDIGDAPGLFALLLPIQAAVEETITPLFDWEEAIDPTVGDTVTYTLEICSNSSFGAGTLSYSGLTGSVYQLASGILADDHRYFWRVTAYDGQGQNTSSEQAYYYFDIAVPEAPASFVTLSPTQDQTVYLTSNPLSWQVAVEPDPGDLVTYTVYLDITAGFDAGTTQITTGTSLHTGFCQPGTLYYWKVEAADTQGHITVSPIARFYVDPSAAPRPPLAITCVVFGDDLQLTWDEVPGADSYLIFAADEPYGEYQQIGSAASNDFYFAGGAQQGTRFYQIKALDLY